MGSTIVLALFVLTAISTFPLDTRGEVRQVQKTDGEWTRRIDEFAWTGPLFMKGLRSLEQFRKLSPLRSEKVETAPNPFIAGQTNEFRTLTFKGLDVSGLVRSTGDFWPTSVVITTAKWRVRDGLGVGTRAARIEGILGPPIEKPGAVLQYQGNVERVNFHVVNGVITKLEFLYYLD